MTKKKHNKPGPWRGERRAVREAAAEAEKITELPVRLVDEPDDEDLDDEFLPGEVVSLPDRPDGTDGADDGEPDEEQPERETSARGKKGNKKREQAMRARRKKRRTSPKVFRAVVRTLLILLVAALLLVAVENRENLSPGNVLNWIRTRIASMGFGDGYPVSLIGSTADPGNFGAEDGALYVVSDTTLAVYNSTAKLMFSARHSFSDPVAVAANDRYLIYNAGGTGYRIETAGGAEVSDVTDCDITTGALSASGKFALAVQPPDYASRLMVYKPDGTLQYRYNFSDMHVSAVALSPDGTHGAVAAVTSRNGELITQISVLDFASETPVATFESNSNFIFALLWNRGGKILAVGDRETLVGDANGFSSFDYGGREVTAYCLTPDRAIVSVSNYAYGGVSSLLIFKDSAQPVEASLPGRASWVSSAGGKAAALIPGEVVSVDLTSGLVEASCAAPSDTRSVGMADEGSVYLLGVRELRRENLAVRAAPEETPSTAAE